MTSISRRATSSQRSYAPPQPVPFLLPSSPLDGSIRAYNSRRIRSRSQREQPKASTVPIRTKLKASNLGDVFQAADHVFRNSLAFKHPSELTLPPRKQQINRIWRTNLMNEEFQQAKSQQIKKNIYASNYRLSFRSEWYKGRPL